MLFESPTRRQIPSAYTWFFPVVPGGCRYSTMNIVILNLICRTFTIVIPNLSHISSAVKTVSLNFVRIDNFYIHKNKAAEEILLGTNFET
jgi:hypothetical protein